MRVFWIAKVSFYEIWKRYISFEFTIMLLDTGFVCYKLSPKKIIKRCVLRHRFKYCWYTTYNNFPDVHLLLKIILGRICHTLYSCIPLQQNDRFTNTAKLLFEQNIYEQNGTSGKFNAEDTFWRYVIREFFQ